jgi:hypothetical protein
MAVSGPAPAVPGRTSPCPSEHLRTSPPYARLGAPPPPRAGALSASTRSSASTRKISSSTIPPPAPAAAPASSPPGPLLHSQVRDAAGRGRTAPAHACLVASLLPACCPPARARAARSPACPPHARPPALRTLLAFSLLHAPASSSSIASRGATPLSRRCSAASLTSNLLSRRHLDLQLAISSSCWHLDLQQH